MDSTEWKGPGVVIGQGGVVIFARHGGTYARVHQFRLRKVDGLQDVLRERDNHLMGIENLTPETRLYENNAEDESEEEAPSTAKGAEDNVSSHTSPCSNTTCKYLKLKTGQVVTYTDCVSGQAHTGKILGWAGKVTGTYKNWYNLQYTDPEEIAGTTQSVDLGQVDNLQLVPSEDAELCTDCR